MTSHADTPELHTSEPYIREQGERRPWLALAIIVSGAFALRAIGVVGYPFEQDELYSAIESQLLFDSPLNPGIEARPLYYLIQHVLLEFMPVGHVTMRLLPMVFGILGVFATWKLGNQVAGKRAATLSVLIIAISPWHMHASGMARYWSLIYLLSCLTFFYILRAYDEDSPLDYVTTLILLLAGIATHPTFAFPVAGFALGLALLRNDGHPGWRWPSPKAWAYLWVPFLVALGGAAVVLSSTGNSSSVQNWGSRGLPATFRLIAAVVDWSTPVLVVVGGIGALILALGKQSYITTRRFAAGALLGMLFCIVLLGIASTVTSVYADYAISMLPLLVVSAGSLVAVAAERFLGPGWLFTSVSSLVLVAGMAIYTTSHLSDGTRFDYRPAFGKIVESAASAPVLSYPIIIQRHYAPDLNGIELQMNRQFLDEQLARFQDLWVIAPVRRNGIWQDTEGALAAWLPQHCRLAHSYERPRFDYRSYRTDLYRCTADVTVHQ